MKKLTRTDLQEDIILLIKKYIFDNKLIPGDALPSQLSMAESMGASRTSVREAIKTMEAKGWVKVINGKGIFVEQIDNSYMGGEQKSQYRLRMLKEYFEVRRALEGYAIEVATKNASDEELQEISKLLEKIESRFYDNKSQCDLDLEFHRKILEISKNSLLIHMTNNLLQQTTGVWNMKDKEAEILTQSIPSHRTVMNYMLARQPEHAVRAYNEYMNRIIFGLNAIYMANETDEE